MREREGVPRRRRLASLSAAAAVAAIAGGVLLGACRPGAPTALPRTRDQPFAGLPSTPVARDLAAPTTSAGAPASTSSAPPTSAPAPTTTTTTAPRALGPGATGPAVLALQQRLTALGYWLGTPDGTFGEATEQAVYALQKAAGIARDGVVGPQTQAALAAGAVPQARPANGYVIEVDLADDLLMIVTHAKLEWTLNTSTGGGYVYTGTDRAITPVGVYAIVREVDGMVTDNLGQLWRPKFFVGGIAIHGDSYVPPYPVSHGCVRVSNEAINWIWTHDVAPIGTTVWVFT